MQPRVTAILVARNGANHLERTLEALASQTRRPDVVVTVDCGSTDATASLLAAFGPTHFISAEHDLTFGQAIAAGVKVTAPPESSHEMLWLLAQDSAPAPGALEALLGGLEIAPSVAVAGPKVMEWDAGDYIHDFGESMTSFGATVTLVESELDQGQRDGMSDVLAVGAGGMLVRHTVWNELGGFDPALPAIDDSLDFCVRVRMAGYRVSVVAAARVASAGDGVAGPDGSSRGRPRRKRLRMERAAGLHRRLVYAPAWALPFHWLSLVPLAFLRSIFQLLRKEPGAILGEFSAAFGAAVHGMRVLRARRRFAATRKLGWASIAGLRVPTVEVRRRRALRREASLTGVRGDRPEIRFLASGGGWTVLAAAVVGITALAPVLGARTLTGGGLLPLSNTPADLWGATGYGWRDIGLGFVGAADPFAAVLAMLGSIFFWAPSFALVALYFLALPLAAFGAWMAASRLTERGSLRAVTAALWVLSPPFLTALAAGRPAAILVHLLLPWLFFAGYAAARSWSASASAALLFAAVVACAPSLAPALLIGWIVSVAVSGRSVTRFIGIPLPALALAAPLIWDQGLRGAWLSLLADPGVPLPSHPVSGWQLVLGFPSGEFGGWTPLLDTLGIPGVDAELLVPILLAPLAVLAAVSLFLHGARAAGFSVLTAVLGLATAIWAGQLFFASLGAQPVGVWAGPGLSLYWLGLAGAVLCALRGLRMYAIAPAVTAGIALLIVVAPLVGSLYLGSSVVSAGGDRTQPAIVTAEAQTNARQGTLQITPQPDGGIRATVVRGAGVTLDKQSTLSSTDRSLDAHERELAALAGNLVSRSGLDASAGLNEFGIRFVLLRPAAVTPIGTARVAPVTPVAAETLTRTTTALDGNAALAPVGDTTFGRLWRHDAPADALGDVAIPANAGGALGLIAFLVAAVVIGATVLLSIPTGAGPEAVRQANRDAIRRTAREKTKQKRLARARARPERAPRAARAGRSVRGAKPGAQRARGGAPTPAVTPTPAETPDPAVTPTPADAPTQQQEDDRDR
ncbi:Glycosyltransferase, GT2 family [Cryobacterium psychrotolerans]|uniref:Glycosyltransferase, GT2 family n=1 Tax=Cryobacterium psychrotolerans TaxID=386301 RepID=A0A1G9CHF0_9MICO|nr:glycosyltransferase family 2 protein [Cryobacterium psychrotolerans]TFD84283.1 glycosyltransferase family 2 protein [Cryobacterium psychrotolerans]SDK51080.1 Glycosyltransferase, GT2 family [Cryobacterium psychrotolerans]